MGKGRRRSRGRRYLKRGRHDRDYVAGMVPHSARFTYEDARQIHQTERTPHAQVIDEALVAKERFGVHSEDYRPWVVNRNRSDRRLVSRLSTRILRF